MCFTLEEIKLILNSKHKFTIKCGRAVLNKSKNHVLLFFFSLIFYKSLLFFLWTKIFVDEFVHMRHAPSFIFILPQSYFFALPRPRPLPPRPLPLPPPRPLAIFRTTSVYYINKSERSRDAYHTIGV